MDADALVAPSPRPAAGALAVALARKWQRGRTDVADQVVEKIAAGAVAEADDLNVFPSVLSAHHALIIDKATQRWLSDHAARYDPKLAVSVTLTTEAEPAKAAGRIGEAVHCMRSALENDDLNAPSGSARFAPPADL